MQFASLTRSRVALLTFFALSLVHFAAQVFDHRLVMDVSQVLLMPPLALWLHGSTRAPRTHSTLFALAALFFSWLGDSAPRVLEQPIAFWSMVGFFLVAQLCFIAALWPQRLQSVLGERAHVGYGLLGFAAAVLLGSLVKLGLPAAVVVLYATAIVTMALLATSMGRAGVAGGLLFIFSDALIALRSFAGLTVPMGGVLIMATYLAAQYLLTSGFVALATGHAEDAPAPVPAA